MAFTDDSISFGSTGLQGEFSNNPTAIDFSKTGEPVIYVAQQDGSIFRYEIDRLPDSNGDGVDEFVVVSALEIDIIPNTIQNYNDDGSLNNTQQRQVTGLVTTTDAAGNDVIYVSSSDWRIAVGTDTGLDTNSGQIHRLTIAPDGTILENVAIIRGLPRSEENHSTNGLDLSIDPVTGDTILWIAQGGNTNKGAPGNNFSGTVDFVLSGTILKVNLTQLESYDVRTDANGDLYILDLPTLDDPTRDNVDLVADLGLDPTEIPENFTIDQGPLGQEDNPDFAGGNNGLNQAKITDKVLVSVDGTLTFVDNPLAVHAPGFRNQYDVLVTEAGEVFTWDNGPNGGWGGQPLAYGDGAIVDDWTTDLATNQFNESGSNGFGDQLHYLGEITDPYGPYGGDPNPLRASKEVIEAAFNSDGTYKGASPTDPIIADGQVLFANEAEARDYLSQLLIIYEEQGDGNWVDVTGETGLPDDFFDIVSGYDWVHPGSSLSTPTGYFDGVSVMDGTVYSPESQLFDPNNDGSLKTVSASTNGLTEYTASFFGGALDGAIVAASFNGNLYFEKPIDTDGDGRTDAVESLGTISGFGSQPLSVVALGDDGFSSDVLIDDDGDGIDDFAGLIFAATYGADNITVFVPGGDPTDPTTDLDLDGLNNTIDSHVGDPTDGLGVRIAAEDTALWHFELNNPATTPPGAVPNGDSIAGDIGVNAVWRNNLDPQVAPIGEFALYNPDIWNLGGASTIVSIDVADTGSAEGAANDQGDVLGLGFAVQSDVGGVTILTEGKNIFEYSLNENQTWDGGEKYGLVVGPGDQSNFVQASVAVIDDAGTIRYGVELLVEENDVNTSVFVEIPGIEAPVLAGLSDPNLQVALDLDLTPGSATAVARVRYVDNGVYTDWVETSAIAVPDAVVSAIRGSALNAGQTTGAFVGLLATAATGDDSFGADWDFVEITGAPLAFQEGAILFRWNAGNVDVAAIDAGPDWVQTGATITGSALPSTQNAATNGLDASVDPLTTPTGLYTNEFYGNNAGDPFGLEFGDGLLADGLYAVRLFMGNGFGGTSEPGSRVFDVSVENELFLDDIDLSGTFGHKVGGMFEWIGVVDDGTIDIDFGHVVENPLINAVEIVALEPIGTGPAISVLAAAAAEGDAGQSDLSVTIQASKTVPVDETVLFTYEVRPIQGGATPEVDYTVAGASYDANTGVYTAAGSIAGGSADFTFPIAIIGDVDPEAAQTLEVVITSVSGADAFIGTGTATITIIDDDGPVDGVVLYRVNAGGEQVAATDGGIDWSADTQAANSPYLVNPGSNNDFPANGVPVLDIDLSEVGDFAAPSAVYGIERWDATADANGEMAYSFVVEAGTAVEVRLYLAENFTTITDIDGSLDPTGDRIFSVSVDGNVPAAFEDIDQFALAGAFNKAVVLTHQTISDGTIDLEFLHNVENPAIKGIEIVALSAVAPPDLVNNVTVPGADFSSDPTAPTAIALAADGETSIFSYLVGGNDDRDFITVDIPFGQRLIDVQLAGYDADAVNSAFIGLVGGENFVLDPAIPALGVSPDGVVEPGDLLGGFVYGAGDVGSDLLPSMNNPGFGFQGFDEDNLTGQLTFWLNQGGDASSTELVFVTEAIPNEGEIVAAINVGGPALTQDGIAFSADAFADNGTVFADGGGGNGEQPVFDGTVYETERFGGSPGTAPLSFSIPVLPGQYQIELYFAEIFQGANAFGARVFDVFIEGQLVLDDFDILLETGGDFNIPVVINVDGEFSPDQSDELDKLDITLQASADNAKLSAIVVREVPQPTGGEATFSVTLNSDDVQTSNFGGNSFQIENTGTKKIVQVDIDVTNALYPDSVFDPFGIAGDTIGKELTINTNGGTGVVAPSASSYVGAGGTAGFEGLQLVFDPTVNGGFDPGETIGFSVDMDPNSIAGATKSILDSGADPAWDIGGISGAELIGSTFTITFEDGTTATGQLQGAGNQGGSQGVASQDSPNLDVTLTVNGLDEGGVGTYADGGPSVTIQGETGQTARIVLTKGIIQPVANNFPDDPNDPNEYHDQLDAQLADLAASDFPANNAAEFQTVDILLDGTVQDISSLFDFTQVPIFDLAVAEDQLPLGFVAGVIDPTNGDVPLGPVSAPIYLTYAENVAPTIGPIAPIEIAEGETAAFAVAAADVNDDPIALTVEVTRDIDGSVIDPALYDFSDAGDGTGAFSWLTGEPDDGAYSIAVTASDGLSSTTTIVPLIVNEAAGPQPGDILYRVNAGGVEVAASDGGPAWSADTAGANSPFLVNPGSNNTFPGSPNLNVDISGLLDTGVTVEVIGKERWDNTNDANGEMAWAFDVEAGTVVEVRIYVAELFTGLPDLDLSGDPTGDRLFDVSVDGVIPAEFNDIDPYALGGGTAFFVGSVVSATIVSDGVVDLEFIHVSENPAVKAIELIVGGEADADGPTAALSAADVTAIDSAYQFTVTYDDATGVDVSTLDSLDVTVSNGALAFTAAATLVSVDVPADGAPRIATYEITPPGGAWDPADNGVYEIALADGEVADILGNVAAGQALGSFTVDVQPTDQVEGGALLVEVTPGGGLGASTFGAGSFALTNASADGVQISSVSFDLSTGILPDMVFDPTGSGGDATASPFTPNSGAAATGLVAPGDPASDPFSAPRNGGFDVLTIDFTDFDPGEVFTFTTDIDPNSIQGVPGAGNAGAVSGYELIGATVTVTFTDGTNIETSLASLFDESVINGGGGSLGGANALVTTEDAVEAPVLSLVDGSGDAVPSLFGDQEDLTSTDFLVQITGPANGTVELLQMDSRLFIASGEPAFDIAPDELPFYANEAMSGKVLATVQLDASGVAQVPLSLLQTQSGDTTPDGGLNSIMAVVVENGEISATSAPLVVKLGVPLVYDEPGVMTFDGTAGSVLELPHEEAFEITSGTVAFSFIAADTAGAQGLFSKDASGYVGGGNHFLVYLNGSTLLARFQDGGAETILSFGGVQAGVEYEVAATFGPNGAELWIDGNLIDTDPLVMDWTQNIEFIQWGGRGWASSAGAPGFDAPFEGVIADKQIYGEALTASQIAALAAQSSASNAAPTALDDVAVVDEDQSVNIDPTLNDSDDDGDTVTVSSISDQPSNGQATIEADGTITYTPDPDFSGQDSFDVEVTDGNGGFAISTVTVTVNPVNDDPTAVDDDAFAIVDTPLEIDVLANDSDPDDDTLIVTEATNGDNGVVTVNGASVTYTPTGGFIGEDTFTYTISDQAGGAPSVATVTVTVQAAPNTPPVAADDDVSVDEDSFITFQPGANDADADDDAVVASAILGAPSNGTAEVNPDGTVTYTPTPDFNGADSFIVQVTDGLGGFDTSVVNVTVNPVNDPPVANDDAATTGEGAPVIINVLANDEDEDGDLLAVDGFTQGAKGVVSDNGNGTLTYTPNEGETGEDTFTYTITDGNVTDVATVTVTINSFPTAIYEALGEMAFDGTNGDVLELPHDPIYEIEQGTIAFSFAAADTNGAQGLFVKDASGYAGGGNHFALYLNGSTMVARFQDGGAQSILQIPGIVAGQSYDVAVTFGPSGGEVWIDGELAASTALVMDWTQNVEFIQWGGRGWGSASGASGFDAPFEGVIADKRIFDVALDGDQIAALFADGPINGKPVAVDDVLVVDEDASGSLFPTLNDVDPENDPLTVAAVESGPSNGDVSIAPDGEVTYTPDADFFGSDSFDLRIEDDQGGFDVSTVNVTVNPVEDDPVAVDDDATVQTGDSVIIDVLANDTDADGDGLSVDSVGVASNGQVVLNPDGTITYTPNANFFGDDTFIYNVSDGAGPTDEGLVTVTVTDLPVLPTPIFEQAGVASYSGAASDVDEYAPDAALQIAEGTIAFSFIDGNPGTRQGLVVKDASGFVGGGNHFATYIEGGDIVFRFQDGGASQIYRFEDIQAGVEYEVAAVFGPDGVGAYVDGDLVGSNSGFFMDWTTNQEFLQVGGLGWASGAGGSGFRDPFSGQIADVEIYDEALDASEIAILADNSSFDFV